MAQNYNDRQRDNDYQQGWRRENPSQPYVQQNTQPYGRQAPREEQPSQQYNGYQPQYNSYQPRSGSSQQGYGTQQQNYPPQGSYSGRGNYPPQGGYNGRGNYPPQNNYDPYNTRGTAYVSAPGRRPRRGRGRSNAPLIVVLVVLGLGILIAGGKLFSIFWNYKSDRDAYSSLASSAVTASVPVSYRDAPEDDTEVVPESEIPIEVDWDYLRSVNSNVVGWLYCPDTVINYPVVQTRDHEFYLTHGFDDSSNTAGTLFADMDSVLGISQSHYIIYGHNMKDDSMFGTVANYVDESYYLAHPTLYYLTPTQCYRIDLFCARYVEADTENYTTYFSSTADYQAYLNNMSSSCFWLNTDVMNTDYQLFSLSTCVYPSGYVNPRLLVQGVMVPIS